MRRGKGLKPFLEELCDILPKSYQGVCKELISAFGVELLAYLLKGQSPDYLCHFAGVCDKCYLVPKPHDLTISNSIHLAELIAKRHEIAAALRPFTATIMSLGHRKAAANEANDYHELLPAVDEDGDLYGASHNMKRGCDWYGCDCNDHSKAIGPASAVDERNDPQVDHNCNGIHGVDAHNRSYEELYCAGTDPRGLIMLGDSASAAFQILDDWVHLEKMDLLEHAVQNELDWPHLSWATSWVDGGASVYLGMRERNLCNHRNFQNRAQNGARWSQLPYAQHRVTNFKPRNGKTLIVAAYLGNDLCSDMTHPENLAATLNRSFAIIDARAAPGSGLITAGLPDPQLQYTTMHPHVHPLNVSYDHLYDFLTCTGINPCPNLLTTDPVRRAAAAKRALELNHVIEHHVRTFPWRNVRARYLTFPMKEFLDHWEKDLGQPRHKALSAVDGFHPSLAAHRAFSQYFWKVLQRDHGDLLGPVNPHNAAIKATFGDQGGY